MSRANTDITAEGSTLAKTPKTHVCDPSYLSVSKYNGQNFIYL